MQRLHNQFQIYTHNYAMHSSQVLPYLGQCAVFDHRKEALVSPGEGYHVAIAVVILPAGSISHSVSESHLKEIDR